MKPKEAGISLEDLSSLKVAIAKYEAHLSASGSDETKSLTEVYEWLHTTPLETVGLEKDGKQGGIFDAKDYDGYGSYELVMFAHDGSSCQSVPMPRGEFLQLKWELARLRGLLTQDVYETVVLADYAAKRETLNKRIVADLRELTRQYECAPAVEPQSLAS
jgi:hypothetical protein